MFVLVRAVRLNLRTLDSTFVKFARTQNTRLQRNGMGKTIHNAIFLATMYSPSSLQGKHLHLA